MRMEGVRPLIGEQHGGAAPRSVAWPSRSNASEQVLAMNIKGRRTCEKINKFTQRREGAKMCDCNRLVLFAGLASLRLCVKCFCLLSILSQLRMPVPRRVERPAALVRGRTPFGPTSRAKCLPKWQAFTVLQYRGAKVQDGNLAHTRKTKRKRVSSPNHWT